jgi:uncharacterized membrane protein YdbT with pleckstrin-like domain
MTRVAKEKTIWEGSPELVAFYGFFAVGILTLILTVVVAGTLGLPLWAWGIALPFCSAMFTLPLLFQRAWRFTVSDRGVRSEFNLWVRRAREAQLGEVTDLVIDQGFVDRLLRIGEIRFDTAGTFFQGVSFWGVRDPFEVRKKIMPFLKGSR